MPTTPLCHRTLTPDPHPRYLFDRTRISEAEMVKTAAAPLGGLIAIADPAAITRLSTASPCLGSRCALWVPEMHESSDHLRGLANEGAYEGEPTGYGVCAENKARAPFADPAGEGKP